MRILTLICLLFLTMCKSQESKTSISGKVHLLYIDTSKYAVLNFHEEYKSQFFDKNCKPTTLSADDIYEIEKIIKAKVDDYNKNLENKFINNPDRYYKQFIAMANSKGEKEVWINCFCIAADKFSGHDNTYWKKGIVMVMDGGNCYFQLKINLTTKQVYDFGVNGEA